ncbi:MAG: hypothetical protein AABY11_01235, partial [archaeon]
MTQDLNSIPRRLRRFYRQGVPVPEEMKHWSDPSPAARGKRTSMREEEENEEDDHVRREAHLMDRVLDHPDLPAGRFERVLEKTREPPVNAKDKLLGLKEKATLHERLPQSSRPVVMGETRTTEIQNALHALKELATQGRKKESFPASFHFTPIGGAPQLPKKDILDDEPSTPSPSQDSLNRMSPKERMEWRRTHRGKEPEPLPSSSSGENKSAETSNPKNAAPIPSHIRRRMGRTVGEDEESDSAPASSSKSRVVENSKTPAEDALADLSDDDSDFKDLLSDDDKADDPSKKKKKKSASEDEDDSLEG